MEGGRDESPTMPSRGCEMDGMGWGMGGIYRLYILLYRYRTRRGLPGGGGGGFGIDLYTYHLPAMPHATCHMPHARTTHVYK